MFLLRTSHVSRHGYQGTMVASQNGFGVVGAIPDASNICLLVARVFDDPPGSSAPTSIIDQSAEWCANNGAKVINLSLGSRTWNRNSDILYQELANEGILVISSAGNTGDTTHSYPASYTNVIGVGSIGSTRQRSSFSNYNSQIDMVAPGEDILSTVPRMALVDGDGTEYDTDVFAFSMYPKVNVSGSLVDCGLGDAVCANVTGKVCLLERSDGLSVPEGSNQYGIMVQNCFIGGGIAAIIYNKQGTTGKISTYIAAPYNGAIPVMDVSYASGLLLLNLVGKKNVTVSSSGSGYLRHQGTSMAAALVSGVAAKIWSARPQCTNLQIREALENTAIDLGDAGRDDYYGNGLIDAEAAYAYLLDLPEPCGLIAPTVPATENIQTESTVNPEMAAVLLWMESRKQASDTKLKTKLYQGTRNYAEYTGTSNRNRRLKGSKRRQ